MHNINVEKVDTKFQVCITRFETRAISVL